MTEPTLTRIGRVRSSVTVRKDMPPLGVPAAVEIDGAFAAGLLHIEKHSHLWVLAWLDQTGREALQVTPRGVDAASQPDHGMHGVFAVRSPTRPNPIGLTVARVTGRAGNIVQLDRLDFIDGTAVIDIKPYYVTRDMIFAASNAQVGRAANRDAIRDALLMQGENFCGAITAELARAAEILAHFRAEILHFADPPRWTISAPAAMAAPIMGMTRVLPGAGLTIHQAAEVTIEAGGFRQTYPV